ncbi:MAG: hypothetical protein DI622_08530 [Chryseobacterium sp.]|uniref:HNH endonuclease n=1 Tax=Chryseobacterium sp. TaxID=1871047 RepID=UPI000DB63C93|nr:HNH endonuclease [Chryseobacterium sp.]MPS66120.1 hypothetical protein [Chryseobacterium sp.]PZU19775.1 MAG: hypothetical protein DI622_08530 [Chryseobacterium sp.]
MNHTNLYIQYHNADKLQYFPSENVDFNYLISNIILDDSIREEPWIYTTKKTVYKAKGGICFLIVGKTENKIKNYYLWCYFTIEDYKENFGEIIVKGTGQDLKRPILLNNLPDFDSFKKFCGNFGIGFQNISKHDFKKILYSFIKESFLKYNRKIFLAKEIQKLHDKMLLIKPERKVQEIARLIRNDRKIVTALKELVEYKCQFPNCNSYIPDKNGINYVEVAHIKPVYQDGQSIIGNLIVLCPNHHKEFDLKPPTLDIQNEYVISGILNGKSFKIDLNNNYSYEIEQ